MPPDVALDFALSALQRPTAILEKAALAHAPTALQRPEGMPHGVELELAATARKVEAAHKRPRHCENPP